MSTLCVAVGQPVIMVSLVLGYQTASLLYPAHAKKKFVTLIKHLHLRLDSEKNKIL